MTKDLFGKCFIVLSQQSYLNLTDQPKVIDSYMSIRKFVPLVHRFSHIPVNGTFLYLSYNEHFYDHIKIDHSHRFRRELSRCRDNIKAIDIAVLVYSAGNSHNCTLSRSSQEVVLSLFDLFF